jgi:hypothetical protein
LSVSDFRRTATDTPDTTSGVAIECGSGTECDAFLKQLEEHFGPRRFSNAADAFDSVKAYVLEYAAKR